MVSHTHKHKHDTSRLSKWSQGKAEEKKRPQSKQDLKRSWIYWIDTQSEN